MKRLLVILLALVLALGMTIPLAGLAMAQDEPVIYGVQRSTGEIYEINPLDGSYSLVFTAPIPPLRSYSPGSPNGLAYDTDNDRLYYTQYPGTVANTAELYFHEGGTQTYAGLLNGEIADADFYEGKYYYIAGGPNTGATDDLYEVTFNSDGTVAANTKIADITSNAHRWTFGGDIGISSEGKLYGWGSCAVHGTYEFFSVDLDGQNFALIGSGYGYSLQLAFSSDDTLYGHNSSGSGYFYTVDLITGVASQIAGSGAGKLYTDMSSGPRIPVQELNEISGYKYADWEGKQIPLPNWEINLEMWNSEATPQGYEPFASTTTDENGFYSFTDLEDGDYRVTETLKDGWDRVSPYDEAQTGNEYAYLVTLPDGSGDGYDFVNTPHMECFSETAWAAQENPGDNRFVPAPGNWATYITYTPTETPAPKEFPLFAGQYYPAGFLYVYNDGDTLYVEYKASGEDSDPPYTPEGYCEGTWTGLTEYHFQIEDTLAGFNDYQSYNKKFDAYGAPIPGQFDYIWESEKVTDTGWIPEGGIDISGYTGDVYIAAHAVMWWCGYDCQAFQEIEEALSNAG